MKLHELSPSEGSKKKAFRVGRGHGSGNGKTSGKGQKGQKARSGGAYLQKTSKTWLYKYFCKEVHINQC